MAQTYFLAVVHHEDGTAYGVSFPDVPDCFAAADDHKDIMKNAIAALDDYFADGQPVPTASGLEQVRQAHTGDLAEGAFLIEVPLIRRTTKTVRANISIEQGLLQAIDDAAERAGLNRSAFLAQIARREIAQGEEV